MLFSEVYGAYFDTVSAILTEASRGELSSVRIREIVREKAFAESMLTIPQKLADGTWPFLSGTLSHLPKKPLTQLQKRWLKALLLDPRISLFDVSAEGLEDAQPLFTPEQFVYYDRYLDGDPFTDEGYIARFKTLLEAIRTRRKVEITFDSSRGKHNVWRTMPLRLEYSSVDDKFRLIVRSASGKMSSVNLKRITLAKLCEFFPADVASAPVMGNESVTFELTDERNALERVMLQFSYLSKETVRLDERHYRVTLHYHREDETELLIRLLSIGPMIRVTAPKTFVALMKERIERQICCELP